MEFRNLEFRHYSVALFCMSIAVIGGAYFLSLQTPIEFSTWVNSAGTIGSIFLSGLIVYIYFQIGTTQKMQFEAQQAQADILLSEQKPRLRFESMEILQGFELAERVFEEYKYNDDEQKEVTPFYKYATGFVFDIHNTGGGSAYELQLNIDGHVLEGTDTYQPLSKYGFMFQNKELSRVNASKISTQKPLMGGSGVILPAGSSDSFFAFTGMMDLTQGLEDLIEYDREDLHPIPLSRLSSKLDPNALLVIEIEIQYQYAGDMSESERLIKVTSPIEDVSNLYDIEDFGRPYPDFITEQFHLKE